MRKLGLVALLLVVLALSGWAGRNSVERSFEFAATDELADWVPAPGRHRVEVADGRLWIRPGNRDPVLTWSGTLQAERVNWISMRVRYRPGPAAMRRITAASDDVPQHEIQWSWIHGDGPAEHAPTAHLSVPAQIDGAWHDVFVPVASLPQWNGTIRALAFDALDADAPLAQIEVDRIRFLRHRVSPLGSWTGLTTVLALGLLATLLGTSRSARTLRPLLTLAAGLSACLFVIELSMNLAAYHHAEPATFVPGVDEALLTYAPSTIWIQRPGATYRGAERFNALGLRGAACGAGGADAKVRVLALGDALTFGVGVDLAQTYPQQLERLLVERLGGTVEVINAGAIDYSLSQGVALFENQLADCRPDVVVVGYGAWVEHQPAAHSDEERIARTQGVPPWIFSTTRFLSAHLKSAHWVATALKRLPSDQGAGRGTRRVVPDDVPGLMQRLLAAIDARGARAVVAAFPRSTEQTRRAPILSEYDRLFQGAAEQAAVPRIDLRAAFLAAAGSEPLWLDDSYPNSLGYTLIAELLARPIVNEIAAID